MNLRTMEPNENGIPRYMRDHARFCFWRMETRKGDITKVPYNPNDPKCCAQTNRPETFGTFGEAMAACRQYGGTGIGVLNDQGLWGIDIDHCVDENGQFSELAKDIIRIMNSPTELSPRGGGVHIYFMAAHTDYSKARYYINNHDIGLEVYPSGESPKYLTVTGRHVDGTPADISGDRSAEIMQVLEKYMVRPEKSSSPDNEGGTSRLEDDELLKKAFATIPCTVGYGCGFAQFWYDFSDIHFGTGQGIHRN